MRKGFGGFDVVTPINRIVGKVALALNVRAYVNAGFTLRSLLSGAIVTVANAVQTIQRLNDSTPGGPLGGFTYIIKDVNGNLYAGITGTLTAIATGMSNNPVSAVAFRPNASVEPWVYIGDIALTPNGSITYVVITTKKALNNAPATFSCSGMLKVRSDGLIYKMGVQEPQLAPVVSTQNTSAVTSGTLLATAIPWTNYNGANTSYAYGETNGLPNPGTPNPVDGTAPFIVNCQNASFITITSLTGTATVNGASHPPNFSSASYVVSANPGFPGQFIQIAGTGATPASASVVVGCFTDGAGNVIAKGVAPLFVPSVVDVGAVIGVSNAIQVPFNAVQFQIGIDSTGNTFSSNSGSYSISVTVTTNALPTVTSTLGPMTLSYFDDSPTSGPVSAYIWKNPSDSGGSGPVRSISNAIGQTTGNSFIFDATFTAGIPNVPGIGGPSVPMEWTVLNQASVATGTNPVFAAPLTRTNPSNTTFGNFNFCLTGSIYFPQAGHYTFIVTNHDEMIWGIGGGVTLVSASVSGVGEGASATLSSFGQTITVAGGYPLLPRQQYTSGNGGNYGQATVVVNVPAAGIYPIEVDYDYWFHGGRILLIQASPTPGAGATIIPPLPAGVRQQVQYRYVYRGSQTGALSNPSPASSIQSIPVTANTISSVFSPDPQVDKVDYYRQDTGLANFTYVATGPNDNGQGGNVNTAITDSLSDIGASANPILQFDNYEPFPSIDLPQSGLCNVSGGVITWVSGGPYAGFNPRWLAGTVILIGAPTQLGYTLIARPVGNTITIPGVPNGTNLVYNIAEPILAAQPLGYLGGPTDNINFIYGVGDPERPGTLYWCKGSNLDSAPDTNQMDVTDPSEPLVNVVMSGGRGVLFSIKRAWVIMPNFFNAEATATGTVGSTWTLQATSIQRGLFIPRCLAVSGGGNIFFRVDDGIHVSPGGLQSESITDGDLYSLFTHEGVVSAPVVRNGKTIYPPDDTQPLTQQFRYNLGYLYYDYKGTDGNYHTLVFDEAAGGWIYDLYTTQVTVHASNESESIQGVLAGCVDGTVRQMLPSGSEAGVTGTLITPAIGGQGFMYAQEVTVEYSCTTSITLSTIAADTLNGSYGANDVTLPATGGVPTKIKLLLSANKWKLCWFQFASTDPTFKVFTEGFAVRCKNWGARDPYKHVNPFEEINPYFPRKGGFGGEQ